MQIWTNGCLLSLCFNWCSFSIPTSCKTWFQLQKSGVDRKGNQWGEMNLLYYCSFWVSVYHYMSNALSFTLSIYLTGSWASWAFVLWSAQCSSPSGRKKMWPKYDEQWHENPWIKTPDNRSRRALAERKVNIWGLVSFSDLEVLRSKFCGIYSYVTVHDWFLYISGPKNIIQFINLLSCKVCW